MSKSAIPSPARSQGAAPRRQKLRRTLSVASPARSDTSAKLVSVVGPYINDEKFAISPMQRRSVLPDDTEIEAPRRASWWKRLEGSSRDVLEALDTNKMPVDLPFDEEVEVEKEKQSQSLPESSDNESVASIVVPQRRLFNSKPQPQSKFGEIMGSRKSLGKSNLDDDNTIYHLPKNLFNKDKSRNRPVFPAALLNSTNKTLNKTVETDVNERQGRNLFGQANKRKKSMFTNFVMSESEDDSEIQHKVFGFKKNDKRLSSGARKRRMPSLTPSVTTDIDMDDWNLLPSSTMIGNGSGQLEVSKISNDESEHMEVDDKDSTLTEDSSKTKKRSLNRTRFSRSRKYQDESDKTLTNEDIEVEQASEKLDKSRNKTNTENQTHTLSKSRKDKTLETSEALKKKNEELEEKTLAEVTKHQNHSNVKNNTDIEISMEDQMAELHGESVEKEKSNLHKEPTVEHQKSTHGNETTNVNQEDDMEKMVWNDDDQVNEDVKDINKSDIRNSVHETTYKDVSHDDENNDLGNEDKSNEQGSIYDKTTKEVSTDEEDNEHDSKDDESNEHVHDKTTNKETSQDDEANDHDGVDSHVTNNSTKDNADEDEVDEEEESNEQDNEESTVNEPSAEVSDDDDGENEDSENKLSENEERVEVSENNDGQNDVDKSEELSEDEVEPEVNNKTDRKSDVSSNTNTTKTLINASHKHPKPFVEDEIDQENDVVEGTPNSSYDTTGINRKKEFTQIKSPKTVLQNMSTDNMSFRPIGRSTSFRKSKVTIEDNLRHTLIQESIGSDGSRNSSTDGSGWDSHRTTRKTLRQTFGKDFTPRKSLRALVMEKSAKRQTEADKNASKMYKTGNKTDIEDQRIRDMLTYNRNASNDQLSQSKSPPLGVSTHHGSPQISQPRLSYNKSEAEQSTETSKVQAQDDSGPQISINVSYGSGMSAVASHQESKNISNKKSFSKTTNISTVKRASARIVENIQEEEELDYDPSVQEDTTHSSKDKSSQRNTEAVVLEQDESVSISIQEPEIDGSEKEDQPEDSEQEIEAESENEMEAEESDKEMADESQDHPEESDEEGETEESQQEIEIEESEQEIEPESEQDIEHEESQQEIEPESEQEIEHEESQQEIEPESEQEIEQEESLQEIEPESEQEESQQEIEDESDHEAEQNVSQESVNVTQEESDPESGRDSDGGREMDSDQDNSVPLDSPSKSSRQTERIVFDNEMSDQEIDYEVSERVSRQITNDDISDQDSEGENEEEQMEYSVSARLSDQVENHNVSAGTKKSMMMIQMEKIAQENMEMRKKIREKVQNSLKQKQDFNRFMSPIKSKFPVGRIKKPEPIKPLRKPRKPTALLMGPLPKEFMEDLKYKPPKRFQPANAPWITKRLYKFLESKLEPKYDYRARVRAEELVQNIYNLSKLARRLPAAPPAAVDELKREMARLNVVTTHFDFYEFFHEFMPREVRVKVNPDIVNKIPMPRNGVFSDILQARPVG